MESAVKYKSAFLASGKIDPLFNILASKNNKGVNRQQKVY